MGSSFQLSPRPPAPKLNCSLCLGTSHCFVALSSSPSRKPFLAALAQRGPSGVSSRRRGAALGHVIVVQLLSRVQLFGPHGQHVRLPCSSHSISRSLLKLMSIELIMPSNHLVLCHLLLLPSVFPSIRVFSNESAFHIRWPKFWSFGISPSTAYSGLISSRIDWFDLLAVQGTLKSFLQHHGLKASIWKKANSTKGEFFLYCRTHPCL